MTKMCPLLTGTAGPWDGSKVDFNAPLPPFSHHRQIHTIPLALAFRTPTLAISGLRTMI